MAGVGSGSVYSSVVILTSFSVCPVADTSVSGHNNLANSSSSLSPKKHKNAKIPNYGLFAILFFCSFIIGSHENNASVG